MLQPGRGCTGLSYPCDSNVLLSSRCHVHLNGVQYNRNWCR
nr:MAG TPA: hypothetical protein [Herelleviridae sp.]